MDVTIFPGRVEGKLEIPASKSYAQRAILAAAFAEGRSILRNIGSSADSKAALKVAEDMGCTIRQFADHIELVPAEHAAKSSIDVGESGLCGRMMAVLLMTQKDRFNLDGSGTLRQRPFSPAIDLARQLNVRLSSNDGYLPLEIQGPMADNDLVVDGSLTSQFISGLLTALPVCGFTSRLKVVNGTSVPYIDMTTDLLRHFGVIWETTEDSVYALRPGSRLQGCEYTVEGDWSSVASLLAVGTAGNGQDLAIHGLNTDSLQPDKAILDVLGDAVYFENDTLKFRASRIPGFNFDATNCPDLFPPLAAIAAFANGPSVITGVHRLVHKESNRAETIISEFGKLGIRTESDANQMTVFPGVPSGGEVAANGDHRIAMALSAIALGAKGPVRITGVECIAKSYPEFYDDLKRVGVRVRIDD